MDLVNREISELIPAEYNPRSLSESEHKSITESIVEFGQVIPIVVNMHPDRKNIIVGGHQRVQILKELKKKTIQCVEVCLDEEKERELNIRLNKNNASWDMDVLANEFDVDDLMDWGFQEFELGIFDGNDDDEIDELADDKGPQWKPLKLFYDDQTRSEIKKVFKMYKSFYGLQSMSECVQHLLEDWKMQIQNQDDLK